MGKHRTLSDGIGIDYLATNDLYLSENTHKFGSTMNPYERKGTQQNWIPPTHPLFYEIILFSVRYKEIEKWLKKEFSKKGVRLDGGDGGTEWVKMDLYAVFEMFKSALLMFPDSKAKLCFNGKAYSAVDGKIVESNRRPNFRLDILGIKDDERLKCTLNNEFFSVVGNSIRVGGKLYPLSRYVNEFFSRQGDTNEHCGSQYFEYKGKLVSELWQNLIGKKW
ncbi:MAG: GIY-YIG nuclease family protein [Paludibacteraceae bacterium]|nr:GIY-YIG nuclease family protein [Paludibacteraceae bacterium]